MILLNAAQLRKHSLILGFFVLLACAFAGTCANAQVDDLFSAAKNGDLLRVKVLLAEGVDVNAKVSNGLTALMAASGNGHLEVVQALLAKGADVNAETSDGATALMFASTRHIEIVQALLAKGADVNAKGIEGATALFLASYKGYIEVVQALIEKGADVNAKTNNGQTALDAATEGGHADVRALLVKAGAKGADNDKTSARGQDASVDCVNQGGKPYILYPNGFILPRCTKVDFSSPNWVTDVMFGGGAYYYLGGEGLPIMGFGGFRGTVAQFNAFVSGTYITLPNKQYGGSILEFAVVSDNCTIHRTPDGKGILTLIIGTTEWLLPDFDLNQASTSKSYVYRGRVIENK